MIFLRVMIGELVYRGRFGCGALFVFRKCFVYICEGMSFREIVLRSLEGIRKKGGRVEVR